MGVLLLGAFGCWGGIIVPQSVAAPVMLAANFDLNNFAKQVLDQTIQQVQKQQSSQNQSQSTPTNSNIFQTASQTANGIPTASGTGGQIRILSGTGSFASVSDASDTLTVSPGASLDGTIALSVLNLGRSDAVAPLIYTPSWGVHSNSWQQVSGWVPTGQSQQKAQLSFTAPTTPGTYHIIFAVCWEVGGDHVASATSWGIGKDLGYGWVNHYDVWDDGNDIADFNAAQISSAQQNGWAMNNAMNGPDSSHSTTWYSQRPYPADAITLVVTGNGTTQSPLAGNQNLPRSFELPANEGWYDAGINLSAPEVITITASGSVYVGNIAPTSNNHQTPNGDPSISTSDPRFGLPFIAPGLVPWSLVGKIGDSGQPFEIGSSNAITAQDSGKLYLSVNDNNFGDNSGSWNVTVAGGNGSLQPTPPSSGVGNPLQALQNLLTSTKWSATDSNDGITFVTQTTANPSGDGSCDISISIANSSGGSAVSGVVWVLSADELAQLENTIIQQLLSQGNGINLNFQNANVVAVVSQGNFLPVDKINKAIKDIGSVNDIEEKIGTASDAIDAASSISQAVGLYCLAEYVSFDPTAIFTKEIDSEFNIFNQSMVLANKATGDSLFVAAQQHGLNPKFVIQPKQAIQIEIEKVSYAATKTQNLSIAPTLNFQRLPDPQSLLLAGSTGSLAMLSPNLKVILKANK